MSRRFDESFSALGLILMGFVAAGCARTAQGPPAESKLQSGAPSRVAVIATGAVAGIIEPCGCVNDQLGGLDRFATAVQQARGSNPTLLLETGALFFPKPEADPAEQGELTFRAEALAKVLRSLNAFAWLPGRADTVFGVETAARLARQAGLRAMPGLSETETPPGQQGPGTHCAVQVLGTTRVGVCGLNAAKGESSTATIASLQAQARQLTDQGATIKISMLDMETGQALRVAEKVADFQLIVLGAGHDDTMGADSNGTEPQRIGQTLVVQPPNHLQGFVVVEFAIRDGQVVFQDGTGVGRDVERKQLSQRISELTERLASWKKQKQDSSSIAARQADLARLQARMGELSKPVAIPSGSYFTVRTTQVGAQFKSETSVRMALDEMGRQINESNREKFASRKAPAAIPGQATYVGVGVCQTCHEKPAEVWRNTRHSQAYPTLQKVQREFTLKCVGCHVTGYEQPGGSSVTDVAGLKNVQCEVCHGPGSIHAESTASKDIQGKPDRGLCAQRCHHSPHVATTWTVDEAWPHILGPGHGKK